ncbi:MAG: efflux RND transporter periplasmic adaptor subunit [Desulfarculaceae bacterium]|nr:efflux RND transporter periplasmic adaptor subunit [Desulfarculaceae bacterium]MCF8072874.1 efflux RND transporter periplasmic adaptor subunit [Desulfarculaceae bacterium]MCF8101042.1 efflux RND transporter periplasmic adaptor subunit [Desulfarculaceae bacterium]MCF8115571.1 efflux RND transporter periplasmic adaptor subunit [Desulfarculaceae bacterium]
MPKPLKVLLVLLLLAAAAFGAYYYFHLRPAEQKPKDQLTLYGNVDIRQVHLAFHANGRIERILVEEGDQVKPGQLVSELDPVRYQANLARTQAEVAAQAQVLARLLAGSRPQEIAEARARLAGAKAALSDATHLYQRNKELYQRRAIPAQTYDSIEARFLAAKADVERAREALNLAIEGPRQQDIAAARAQLEALKAARQLAERELKDTKLYATGEGVIQQRILEPGDMASPSTPAFTVALNNPVWVRAYVPETMLGKVVPGMAAAIHTDSFPDRSFPGWVGYISPTAEFTPKTVQTPELRTKLVYRARIYACNPGHELRLGMPVTVTLDLKNPKRSARGGQNPCPGQ